MKTPEKTQQSGDTAKLTGKPEESGSEKKGKKTFPPCSYCGKSGHSKKNCFKKKKDKREAEVNLVETTAGPLEDASAAESGNVEAKEAAEDMAFMEECEALYSNDAIKDHEKALIELNGECECWAITDYDQGMGNRGEVFMTGEGFEPGTWSLELWDLKRFELRTL